MKISQLIKELESIKAVSGDIEVTCTASARPDASVDDLFPDIYESTVENLILRNGGPLGRRVRLYF